MHYWVCNCFLGQYESEVRRDEQVGNRQPCSFLRQEMAVCGFHWVTEVVAAGRCHQHVSSSTSCLQHVPTSFLSVSVGKKNKTLLIVLPTSRPPHILRDTFGTDLVPKPTGVDVTVSMTGVNDPGAAALAFMQDVQYASILYTYDEYIA